MKPELGTVTSFHGDLGIGRIKPDSFSSYEISFRLEQGRRVEINGNGNSMRFVGTSAKRLPRTGDRVIFHPSIEPTDNFPSHWAILPSPLQLRHRHSNQDKTKKGEGGKSKVDNHCRLAAGRN